MTAVGMSLIALVQNQYIDNDKMSQSQTDYFTLEPERSDPLI